MKISEKGFSLVELLVVIAMLAGLIGVLLGLLNPLAQFQKAKDAARQQEVEQLKTALDAYYNDTGCYPTTLPLGDAFAKGKTVYMKSIPQDPDCIANPNKCFIYQTDNSSCPQWNVLYASLDRSVSTGSHSLCPLQSIGNCLPTNLTQKGYNYCISSGSVSCPYLSSNPLPTPVNVPAGSGGLGGGNGENGTIVPTPTPTAACNPVQYKCTGASQQNPFGTCDKVGIDGNYCGFVGCVGNDCCDNQCSQ